MKVREWHPDIPTPTSEWFWDGIVTQTNEHFTEVEFYREPLPWLVKLTEQLAPHHRTWLKQTVKIYNSSQEKNQLNK